ncbi:hypothetical protein MMC11_000953 [Xylographa trunciseda]|nr:hypothetical protein [Xylographa trunciseda]
MLRAPIALRGTGFSRLSINLTFRTADLIYVSPSPHVPNWNEPLQRPLAQKEKSSALYQLYVAMFDQECALSPLHAKDEFNDYIRSLAEFYLEKLYAQGAAAAGVALMPAEEVNDPGDVAGPSNWQAGESGSGAVG